MSFTVAETEAIAETIWKKVCRAEGIEYIPGTGKFLLSETYVSIVRLARDIKERRLN